MDIVCAGDITLDIVNHNIPKKNEIVISDVSMNVGGNAAITAVALASLGLNVGLVGYVGNDPIGKYLLDKIKSYGVRTFIKKVNEPTSISTVLIKGNDRRIVNSIGANKLIPKKLPRAKAVFIGGYVLTHKALNLADGYKLRFTDIGAVNKKHKITKYMKSYIRTFNFVFASGSPEVFRNYNNIVVHADEKGSYIITDKVHHIPTKKTVARNPVGAGDVYNAGFIYGIIRGYNAIKSAKLATKAALFYIRHRKQTFPKNL
ncbi:MAG TPA: hypothetical protein ENG01_01220 [Candidatus Aenigmarchaeota archaeon]|nr:hypothetical protein [Candidatus Aenigmarchaeota archaeon]HEX33017.1 hypothetical protein [Candidatus Aenigmarchaeota archaeon]